MAYRTFFPQREWTAPRFLFALGLTLALVAPTMAPAGGFLVVSGGGVPAAWGAGTITMRPDAGPFSATVANATADAFCLTAINRWNSAAIPTCTLTFALDASELPADHGLSTGAIGPSNPQLAVGGDSISPLIYDQTGLIHDALLGAGANMFVIGFAGPQNITGGGVITEGQAVINGRFLDGAGGPADITQALMEAVTTHEIGHMLNLDHAQLNDSFAANAPVGANFAGYPTMYPIIHGGAQTLEFDDTQWVSHLYPTAAFTSTTTTISGLTRTSALTLVNGVNIIARRTDSNPAQSISCVSGYLDGTPTMTPDGIYRIPGLPANTSWALDFEEILPTFVSGSSVGPLDPPLSVTSPAEYLNEAATETNSDTVTRTTTFRTGAGGTTFSGINLTMNTASAPTSVAEVDSNSSASPNLVVVTPGVPRQVTGSCAASDVGNITLGANDIEDYFAIQPVAGLNITSISLTGLTQDLDLYVGNTAPLAILGFSANGGTTSEVIEGDFDTAKFAGGQLQIWVDNFGGGTSNFTLTIEAGISDSDAVFVTGTSASIDPTSGSMIVQGTGFKNTGGNPTVTTSDPNIIVGGVSSFSATSLTVSISAGGGFTPGLVDVTVTNQAASGGYSGRRIAVTSVPVELSAFGLE